MTAPTRTTFEVKVSNKLSTQSIWVRIASELNYAKQLISSNHHHNQQNTYDQHQHDNSHAFAKSRSNSEYNNEQRESSNYNNNKSHIKSTYNSSNSHSSSHSSASSSSNTSSKYGGGSVSLLGCKVGGGGGSATSNSSSSNSSGSSSSSSSLSTSTDNLQHNISANSRKSIDQNAMSENKSNAASASVSTLNISSLQLSKANKLSQSSLLENKIIEPGFVRITPLQSLPIPVITENESQVVYITVYIIDYQGQKIMIANQLQINRQSIEITRNEKSNDIMIQPAQLPSCYGDFRDILLLWGLPEYLCDAMKRSGWHNPKYWDDITKKHLIEMGFKPGHCIIFNNEYIKYKMRENMIKNQLNYKNLLKAWNIPIHLYDNMKENGWDDIYLWQEIDEHDLREMNFKKGHIKKFQKYVNKNNQHIKQFEQLIQDSKENKTFLDDGLYEDDDNKSKYDKPNMPSFTINQDSVTNNSFMIELETIKNHQNYAVQMDENNSYEWKRVAELRQSKCYKINNLKANTVYSIRIRAESVFQKSDWSKVIKIKTKDKKWVKQNSITIPSFKYHVTNHYNTKISISFDSKEMDKIKKGKYDEKYILEIGLSYNNNHDDEKQDTKMNWNNIGYLQPNTLTYEWNVNNHENINFNTLSIRISSLNDLSYLQYSSSTIHKIVPTFEYEITNNNDKIFIEFEEKRIDEIKNEKCKYIIQFGLIKAKLADNGIKSNVEWIQIDELKSHGTGQVIYEYSINDINKSNGDGKCDTVTFRIASSTGSSYSQYSSMQTLPLNKLKVLTFYTKCHGLNLKFNNHFNATAVTLEKYFGKAAACLFGFPITSSMCNKYEIFVKVINSGGGHGFYFGYVQSKDDIKNWNCHVGCNENKNSTFGIRAQNSENLQLCDANNDRTELFYDSSEIKSWSDGSIFILSFDFTNNQFKIYLVKQKKHKRILMKTLSLKDTKTIWPAFSFYYTNESIEITRWKLY